MYVTIGRTKKAHGLTGEIKMHIEEQYIEDFLKNERIFIDVRGTKVPYFVANVRGTNEFIVHLEEVNDREVAQTLQSREICLREKDLIPDDEREMEMENEGLEYAHLIGYVLSDQRLGDIGPIDEVLEMPQQEMAFLKYQGREALVPLNPHLIIQVDDKTRKVLMDLPEGLLD
jgi:16S rRNA processing protein RimM